MFRAEHLHGVLTLQFQARAIHELRWLAGPAHLLMGREQAKWLRNPGNYRSWPVCSRTGETRG